MMKKFLVNFILFLIPVLVFAFVVDKKVNDTLRKTKCDDFGVWNEIFAGKANHELLVYGSSRAWVHIDPSVLQDSLHLSVYNLGMDGYNFDMSFLRHQILMEKGKPKIILYALDCFTLYKRADLYNMDQFLPYLDNGYVADKLKLYEGLSYWDDKVPFVKWIGRDKLMFKCLNGYYADTIEHVRDNGFKGQLAHWTKDVDDLLDKQKSYFQQIDTPSKIAFEQFINYCRDNNIQLIFTYPPEHIRGQQFVENRSDIINLYKKMSAKYNVPFLDYSDDSLCTDKQYFYNSQHLNSIGAEIYSKHLASDMKALLHQ